MNPSTVSCGVFAGCFGAGFERGMTQLSSQSNSLGAGKL
jgi:hypothetical protein